MGPLMWAVIAAFVYYLYLVSKQRRQRGLPPLPVVGPIFEVLLESEESAATSEAAEEVPRPVAVLKGDVAQFMADENESVQPHPIVTKCLAEPSCPPPNLTSTPEERKSGAGMASTYLMMPKDGELLFLLNQKASAFFICTNFQFLHPRFLQYRRLRLINRQHINRNS